ncbi:ABC transporter permease, partial [Candidatus Hydrogenedentota bacterium]
LLTMLGVIIGVTSVILLVSLGEAAQRYVELEFAGMGSNILIITPGKSETSGSIPLVSIAPHELTLEDSDAVGRRGRGVRDVAPLVFAQGYVKYGNRKRNTTILGVTNSFQEMRDLYVENGQYISKSDVRSRRRVVAIGRKIEQELFPNESPLGKLLNVNGTKYRIVGIMENKGYSLGMNLDDMIFIPVSCAQQLFNTSGLIQILVSANSESEIKVATESAREILMKRHNNEEDFTIVDQTSMLGTFDKILRMLTFMIGAIAGISLIVGGIGIMNIMLVSVRERVMEIGLRKAVGARRMDILLQFLIEAIVLSATGGTIGIAIGAFGIVVIRLFEERLPAEVSPWSVLMAFGFSVAVGVFFGVYPARRAADLDPVDALRYE